MIATQVNRLAPYTFHWWSGEEETYEACYQYRVNGLSDGDLFLAFGSRFAFGMDRRRVLVFRDPQRVLIELVGADDWEQSREVIWLLKRPSGRGDVLRAEDIPKEFAEFDTGPFSRWISGAYTRRGHGVRVKEEDHETIVRLALIREQHRRSLDMHTAAPTHEHVSASTSRRRENDCAAEIVRKVASYSSESGYLGQHLYAFISRCIGRRVSDQSAALEAVSTPSASLSLLLGYFAFARQGGERAGYNEICLDLLSPFMEREKSAFWDEYPGWEVFYEDFVAACMERGIGTNDRINRGLVRDVYEMAAMHRDRGLFDVWAEQIRRKRRVATLFEALTACHGVGPKIAAFVCRDTVFLAGAEDDLPEEERRYLQPVDIWIGRIAEFLNADLVFGKDSPLTIASYLAQTCVRAGVSGVAFNQGGWYLGSRVAGTAVRLIELLTDIVGGSRVHVAHRRRLVVVGCGNRKIWGDEPERGPCAARLAYCGAFFQVNRKYAERFAPGGWLILSSRYGFLMPDTPITDYNARFDDPATNPMGVDQLRVSAIQTGVTEYDEVEILAGRAYVTVAAEALGTFPLRLILPYARCGGNGEMMELASRAVELGRPIDELSDTEVTVAIPEERSELDARHDDTTVEHKARRSRPTSNPDFIRRAFVLHADKGLRQVDAMTRAANEFGIALPASYLAHPGVHFSRWRRQGYGPPSR